MYPVDDKEFATYGYVDSVYGGESGEVLVIQHSQPPQKRVQGEVVTTNLYYNPVTTEEKERVRVARMVLSGVKGKSPCLGFLCGRPLKPTPQHLVFGTGSEERGILIGDIEIIANLFENLATVPDLDEVEGVTEYINLLFVGSPTIHTAFNTEGILFVEEQPNILEALSVLFGRAIYLTH